MIGPWMLAATGFALLLGAAAHALESAARRLAWPGRSPWVAALGASLVWPVLLPLLARRPAVRLSPIGVAGGAVRAIVARLPAMPSAIAPHLDTLLMAGWGIASVLLAVRLVRAQVALARLVRSARATTMDGHPVLVTDDSGPAAIGIATPQVVVPAWLTDLDAPLRALVLRHEREHGAARDLALLWLGEAAVALMPWNPALWWQARRLRLALELDCDARTLRQTDAAPTYGILLLLIAQRQRLTRLAPMLAESTAQLSRRITAMTRPSRSHPSLRAAAWGAIAVVAIVAACSSRLGSNLASPQPMGGARRAAPAGQSMQPGRDGVYFEYQVEHPVMSAPGNVFPRYPDILKLAGVDGEVYVSFVVDTMGRADVTSLTVIKSSHQLFRNSVVAALPDMRFTPARVGGRKVKQLVMEPFVFSMVGGPKAAQQSSPGVLKAPDRR